MIQTWIIDQKPQIWANLGLICPILGQKNFFSKIGLRHFFDLLKTSLMQKIKEILWTVSEKNSGQTNERTDMGQSIGPTSKVGGSKKLPKISISKIAEKWLSLGPCFFSKIGLRAIVHSAKLDAKNQKNLMAGSMRTFGTDRRTDIKRKSWSLT